MGWISNSSNRDILPRIARVFSRSSTDRGGRSRRRTSWIFCYVWKEDSRGGAYVLTVAETAVASVLSAVQIRCVSCTKECHAQGPSVLVSLGWVALKARSIHDVINYLSSYSSHALHCIIGIIGINYRLQISLASAIPIILITHPIRCLNASIHLSDIFIYCHIIGIGTFFSPFSLSKYVTTCFMTTFCMIYVLSATFIFVLGTFVIVSVAA